MKVLVLAGTGEASALVRQLAVDPGIDVVASLAGHTEPVNDWPCPVRAGGFGGAGGLAAALHAERFDALIDATHPYSPTMPRQAADAATAAGVAHLRLERPAWSPHKGDRWETVADLAAVVDRVQELGAACAFVTVGRLDVAAFRSVTRNRLVVRSITAPDPAHLPASAVVVTARGPFAVDAEMALMRRYGIDVLVTKNSGGDDAKLRAARQLGVPTVMVRRPTSDVAVGATTVDEAVAWARSRLAS
jgi:precorrin-6A/cobalt-precorrin-6A reductase